jgi:hypothetical protein
MATSFATRIPRGVRYGILILAGLLTALPIPVGAADSSTDAGMNDQQQGDQQQNDRESRTLVFGSGSYGLTFGQPPCPIRFSLRASMDEKGRAHGFQTATYTDAVGCGGLGQLRANVTCVSVVGGLAELRGVISESTGAFASFVPVGSVLASDVLDSEQGQPDRIFQNPLPAGTDSTCQAVTPDFFLALDRGSIEVAP